MAVDMRREFDEARIALRNRLERVWVERFDEGDFAENLLEHLRTRERPRLFFTPSNLSKICALTRRHDPAEYAWEQEIADNAVEGRLYGASNAYCRRFIAVDRETFDFSRYDHPDPQTICGLGRHRWYVSLARAYWDNGDRKYFDALMDQWDFYAEKVPPPSESLLLGIHAIGPSGMSPPYGELDVYIRLTFWWWAYWTILHAPEMTPERNAVLLARCLGLFDLVAARGIKIHEHNFTSMQMESLILWAVALPEVTGMRVWKHAARNIMEASLDRAVTADGVHWEKSVGYHRGCIKWYGASYLLGQINNAPWADAYGERLRRMGQYLDAVITPDGRLPLISDTDRDDSWRMALSLLKVIFPDETFRHPVGPSYRSLWHADGRVWEPPAAPAETNAVALFPQGGVAVARHEAARSMVILDNGPNAAGHAHKNNLTVHYEALGHPALVDPGRAVYRDDADRRWVTSCQAHNTVYIEDEPVIGAEGIGENILQRIAEPGDLRLGAITSRESDGLVILTSAFKGYRDDVDAMARRCVVMPVAGAETWLAVVDRIDGPQPHTWTHAWLLPAREPVVAIGANAYEAALDNDVRLRFAVWAETPLAVRDDAMFWCPSYAEKSPARWVRFSGACAAGARAFLFRPPAEGDEVLRVALAGDTLRLAVAGREIDLPLGP